VKFAIVVGFKNKQQPRVEWRQFGSSQSVMVYSSTVAGRLLGCITSRI